MNKRKHILFLCLGSNLGDRKVSLIHAEHLIAKSIGKVLDKSSIYETAPWGHADQPYFLNRILKVEVSIQPIEVMKNVLKIEETMGRKRTFRNASRIIDIDIIFFGEMILQSPALTIPHPEMQNRRFVLVPLNEIASEIIHPVFKKNISELALECTDTLGVTRYGE